MAEGLGLLQELKNGSYQAAILGSYNVSFPFFEQVVLRALRSHGSDHNVLLMDAAQCAACLGDDELAPRSAGRLYALVPVAAPGVFHPKFLLLLGKRQSKLILGSHNLTLSGFGLNREISNMISIHDRESEGIGRAAFDFALAWAGTAAGEVAELVEAARNWAPWLAGKRGASSEVAALGTYPIGPCLWDQLEPLLGNGVSRITVLGPYFDNGMRFITTLRNYSDAELVVAIHPEHSQLDPVVAKRLPGVSFKDLSSWQGDHPKRLVHAKAIHFVLKNGESVFVSGSANPSAPAWLDAERRNAELVVVRWLPKGNVLADHLGITSLRDCPDVTEAVWQAIDGRRASETERVDAKGQRAWVALENENGFTVESSFAGPDTPVAVLDAERVELLQTKVTSTVDSRRMIGATDNEVRQLATYLEVNDGAGVRRAVVQHLHELRDRATSKERRSLRKALMDLDMADEGIDVYMAVIEKAIFDGEPAPRQRAGRTGLPQKHSATPEGSVGVGELEKRGRRRPRLSTGDVGVVLDALIHKLGEGLPGVSAAAARISEEQVDEHTEIAIPRTRAEQRALAQRCRLKTRKLIRRMLKRLELAWNEEAEPFAVAVQFVACLGLLHRISERQAKFEWLPAGGELVETEWLWKLFKRAAVVGFAPRHGARTALEAEHGEFSELASAAALTLWSAWTTGLDLGTAMSTQAVEDEEQEENLTGLSLLLNCLDPNLMPDDEELAYLFGEDGRAWLDRHMKWASAIRSSSSAKGAARPGSVVRFLLGGDVELGVVVKTLDGKVEVMDRTTGALRRYDASAVERLALELLRT